MAASAYTGTLPDMSDAAPGQEDVQALSRRYDSLLRRRAPWDSAWQSLADHFLPTRCRLNPQAYAAEEGPMLNRGLVDATGILAMRTLAAGLQGGLAGATVSITNTVESPGLALGARPYLRFLPQGARRGWLRLSLAITPVAGKTVSKGRIFAALTREEDLPYEPAIMAG